MTPAEYFWGVAPDLIKRAEQGGVYNRGIKSVRIERLPATSVEAMHAFFKAAAAAEAAGKAQFNLVLAPLLNLLPGNMAEKGNCAAWTSRGLR